MPEGILEKGYWENADRRPAMGRLARFSQQFLDIIRPSILEKATAEQPSQVRRTAYLDGLRGFAALLVYFGHHQLWAHEEIGADRIFENAYGFEGQYYFACLPFVRTFFSGGHFAVAVFFIISGYVLSVRPLQFIQSGEYVKLGDNLGSALFRRWIRLFWPIICCTFLYMTSFHLFGIRAHPKPERTYADELWKWYAEFKNFSFVFRTGGDPWFSYSFHTWSIPVEFRGSIIIYTSLMAFSRCTRNARLAGEAFLMFYFMYIVDGWYGSLFVGGMMLADLDLLAAANNLPEFFSIFTPHKDAICYTLLVMSLYLGGAPAYDSNFFVLTRSPGWGLLSHLKPSAVYEYKWFYLFWAALFANIAIPRIQWLRRFFETKFCQYLGRISFSFYLVHGPVLWTLGDRLYAATGWPRESSAINTPGWTNKFPLSKAGPLGLELSFLAPNLILLPFTFWVAEIAYKLFDEPALTFGKRLYALALPSPTKQ